jgi:DNA-binding IclR family transcriptional regulator
MSNIQSIQRAFAILRAVAANPKGLGLTEIAHQVGLPISTVARLLATLEGEEAIERVPNRAGFRIGPGTISLVLKAPYHRHLTILARPCLLELAEATREAVGLCLLDGDKMHVVDLIRSPRRVQVADATGDRFPAYVTSPGKVLLAYLPEETLDRYLARPLESYTPKTVTDPNVLRQQLALIRKQGYSWVFEELEEIAGVSAPIWDNTGAATPPPAGRNNTAVATLGVVDTPKVVAAVNVYGPAFRFPPEGQEEEITRLVVETGQKITARIREYST